MPGRRSASVSAHQRGAVRIHDGLQRVDGSGPRGQQPAREGWGLFTVPANFAGTPAICLPSGYSPEGLPYSIQFVGRHLSEPVLCRIAQAYEQATSWHARHPSVDTM